MASGYVLIHKDCGHPLALSARRANLENHDGPHALRIRFATDRDIEAFVARTRCETCSTGVGLDPAAPQTSSVQRAVNQAARLHPNA